MKKFLLAGAAAGLTIAAASGANAQSIDYGAMEQLFNEPVTTSATGSPQRATEVPVDMTIISATDIKRSGAFDLPTILSRVAGVDVLNFAAANSDVGVRGYNQARSPRLLVLVNGRQVYLDHFGYTDWSSIPVALNEIRQIEVVRGPNSAIFGFNAVSGVVNIITYNPKYDAINAVQLTAGTQNALSGSLVKTFKFGDKFSARASVGFDRQSEWENTTSLVTAAQLIDPSNTRANIDAVAQLSPSSELRVEASMFNGFSSQVISTFAYSRNRLKTDSYKATYTADTKFGHVQLQAYHNDLDASVPGRTYLSNVTVASAEDLFKIGAKNTIRVGVEYRANEMDTASALGGVVSYTVVAPSVMWNYAVSDKLSLTAAGRLDRLQLKRSGTFPAGTPLNNNNLWDRNYQETSANLGAVYKATAVDTLRATYARGVQAPTLLEIGGLVVPPATAAPVGVLITGTPNLEPAIVTNYQVSYGRDLPALKAKMEVKVFVQETVNVKGQFAGTLPNIPATATTWSTVTYTNASDSKMNGVEVSASGRLGAGFHWSGDATYTNVTDESYTNAANLLLRKVDFAATSPEYRGNLAAGWTNKTWMIDGFVHFVGDYSSYNGNLLEPVEAYSTFAGRIAYLLPMNIQAAINGQNLLRDRQYQGKGVSGLQAERRVVFSINKSW